MSVLVEENNASLIGEKTRPLNLTEGGQQGAMMSPHQWNSNAGYVRQNVIAVLLAAPQAMRFLENADHHRATLKSLIEVMPIRVEGLNSSVTWEYGEVPVGNGGEMFESVVNAVRERSIPAFAWNEKYGQAIARWWTEMGRKLVLDPDLKVPGIVAEEAYRREGSPNLLPEMCAMTVLFIEPDETMTNVINAWMCTNMMPKSGGEIIGRKEIAGASEVPEVSIEFTALTLRGSAVDKQAKDYLANLNLEDMRPTELKPFVDGISAEVDTSSEGYANKISEVVENL